MNKLEFINALGTRLDSLPREEIAKTLDYFVEIIDDHVEDGMTEEAAIDSLGPVEDLAKKVLEESSALAETHEPEDVPPPPQPEPAPAPSRGAERRGWSTASIVLVIVGSPIWVPLLIAAVAVVFGIVVAVFSVLVGLFAAAVGCIIGGAVLFVACFFFGNGIAALLQAIGAALACFGVGLLLLPAAIVLTRLCWRGLVALCRWIGSLFVRKERA